MKKIILYGFVSIISLTTNVIHTAAAAADAEALAMELGLRQAHQAFLGNPVIRPPFTLTLQEASNVLSRLTPDDFQQELSWLTMYIEGRANHLRGLYHAGRTSARVAGEADEQARETRALLNVIIGVTPPPAILN